MDWRHRALCTKYDPELFFAIGESGPALNQNEAAKAVCYQCPVIHACLSWALESGQDEGVWGGLDRWERRQLRQHGRGRAGALQVSRASLPG